MNKIAFSIRVFLALFPLELNAQFIISSDTSLPDSSSYVEVKSNERGWLIPRMTTQQRDAIQDPAAGLMIYNTDSQSIEFFNTTTWVNINAVASNHLECGTYTISFRGLTYGTVAYNGRCWLDRNLGASKVADSVNDSLSYGYYYQWGRGSDGHQSPTSDTTWVIATGPNPGHGDFILSQTLPKDWMNPQDPGLWNVSSDYLNNPCPPGWKVPELADWCNLSLDWESIQDGFDSPLKLPAAGMRTGYFGNFMSKGTAGFFWSSRPSNTNSFDLVLMNGWILLAGNTNRTHGFSVRCLRDEEEPAPTFARLYGGTLEDCGYGISRDANGNLLIIGYTQSFDVDNTDYMLIKVDEDGILKWGKTYGFYYFDTGHCVLPTMDDGYLLVGTAGWGSTYADQMYVVKTDSLGDIEWDYGYGSTGYESGYDAVQEPDSSFILLGSTDSFGFGGKDIYFRKSDADGNYVFSYAYGTSGDDQGYSLIKDTDGGWAILGEMCCSGGLGGTDMEFVKIIPQTYNAYLVFLGGSGNDGGRDLVSSHDSGYVCAGYTYSYGNGSSDFYINKLDKNRNSVWSYAMGGSGADVAESIIMTADSGFAILGETTSFGQGQADMWLVKIDRDGQFEWSFAFGFIGNEKGRSLTQDENGYLYAAGYLEYTTYLPGQPDFLLVQFAPDGSACLGEYIGSGGDRGSAGPKFHQELIGMEYVHISKIDGDMKCTEMKIMKLGNDLADPRRAVLNDITPAVITICE